MRTHSYYSTDVFLRQNQGEAARVTTIADMAAGLKLSPQLEPRDEAIFWLTAAAEVEHFLMVHYLYATYSLDPAISQVRDLQDTLRQIAREEMGHLITVQNLLILLGAPLHFGREHSPFASEIYPFRFKLERVSLESLAKYTVAESPVSREELEKGLEADDLRLFDCDIQKAALASNDARPVRHVGPIFARLKEIFDNELTTGDLRLDRASRQARWSDWGYRKHPFFNGTPELRVLVHHFDQANFVDAKKAAVCAIEDIGDQGEAADVGIGDGESHFERFLWAYKELAKIEADLGHSPVLPVLNNPNVTEESTIEPERSAMVEIMLASAIDDGRILDTRSRAWAQLFNLRYRLLLRCIQHALLLSGPVFTETGTNSADRTAKGLLVFWAFKEMRRVGKIARKLVRMPSGQPNIGLNAAPPFELPYSLGLSTEDSDRWVGHRDVLRASIRLTKEIQADLKDFDDEFLTHIIADDERDAALADVLSTGADIPADFRDTDFRKAVTILDEAVRGFPVERAHMAFWQEVTRDEFVTENVSGDPPVVVGDPENSNLYKRISPDEDDNARMPRFRPRIDQTRIDFIHDWIKDGAPDNKPAGEIGIAPEPDPKDEVEPTPVTDGTTGVPGFSEDIRPLFKEVPDRMSMLFLFDLHDYDDVKDNAKSILASLESGRMPCTMKWPPERIALFRDWMDAGFAA